MGDNFYVTDSKPTGGKVGSIFCCLFAAIFFNFVANGMDGEISVGFRIFFAILSIGSIPIAVIGQRMWQKIYAFIRGDTASVHVSDSLISVIAHKFGPAIITAVIYNSIILLVVGKLFGEF